MTRFLYLLLIIFFSINLFSQNEQAELGVIDLRDWDLSKKTNIKLKGEWEFYWKKLYTPEDFNKNKIKPPTAYLEVPGTWKKVKKDGKLLPDTGFATYRLVIFVDTNKTSNKTFMIRVGEVLSSYKLWVNDKKIIDVGKVAQNSNIAKPAINPTIKKINLNSEKIQIIVQVSNYNHHANSFFQVPIIGEQNTLLKEFSLFLAFDIIILGAVLIMAFYHLGLFIFRRKNIAAIAFSLLCLVVVLRILFSSNYILNFFFPSFPWEIVYRINFFTYYALVISFLFFVRATFNDKKHKLFYFSGYIVSALFIITLFFNSLFFTRLLFIYQIFTLFLILFTFYLFYKFIKQKKIGAIYLSVSILLFFITGVNDILYFNDIIKTATLSHLGIFILILGQSLTLARIFNNAFDENEKLTQKLDYQNKNLQKIVNQRTKEIQEQKQDILQKNEELQVQKEELQVQKDEIVRQKDLLEYKNKFITDSINYASTIQKAVLPANEDIKKYFNSFIIFIPKDIVSGDFYFFSDYHRKYNFVSVGDCTGHGVPGAFLSLIGMYILNSVIIERQRIDPKDILNQLEFQFNKFLHKGLNENRDGMELGIFRFDKNSQSVVYAAAKTNMFIYDKKDKSLKRYRGTRKSIGVNMALKSKEIEFENYNFLIDKNKVLYCATDGFVDQSNDQRNRFGTKRFMRMLKNVGDLPVQQQKISIIKNFEDYRQEQNLRDDITIIGLITK